MARRRFDFPQEDEMDLPDQEMGLETEAPVDEEGLGGPAGIQPLEEEGAMIGEGEGEIPPEVTTDMLPTEDLAAMAEVPDETDIAAQELQGGIDQGDPLALQQLQLAARRRLAGGGIY